MNMKKIIICIILFTLSLAILPSKDYSPYFKTKAREYYNEAVELRRTLHAMPELCFCEQKTSALAADYLRKLGLEVQSGIGGTGFKAILRGQRATPVLAIRTDMDALPITEATGLSFASQNQGVMHACGHDMHMTNVLLTAKLLAGIRNKLPGTVVFIFQPCEEGAAAGEKSGADRLIAAGILEAPHVDAIIGLHIMPDIPSGQIGLCPGPLMAGVAWVYVTIEGKSSHGAFPHQGIDAIYAASSAVIQFQSLISRQKDPAEKAVLTIGKMNGGVRRNVLADYVQMEGTVRSFSLAVEKQIEEGMGRILQGLEIMFGVKTRLVFERANSFVKNDPQLTGFFLPVFRRILGADNVKIIEPLTIGEDFAAYSHRIPALFFFLGVGQGEKPAALHTPDLNPDEKTLMIAPALFASAALSYLQNYPVKGGSKNPLD
jgi:amidohydrolase